MSLRRFFRRKRWDRERLSELDSYLRIATDEYIAAGLAPAEARQAAIRKLGSRARIREEIYTMNTMSFLDALTRDLRYAFRAMRHHPMFTAVAVLTLALGIGANTAIFTVVNGILIKALPYPEPERLIDIRHNAPGFGAALPNSNTMAFTYAEQNRVFEAFGLWMMDSTSVTGLEDPEMVDALFVTAGTLPALQVPPLLGRWLSAEDQVPGSPEMVMITHGYWQRRFAGDPNIIGRSITIDSKPRSIIGVMPAHFRFLDARPEIIAPFKFDRSALFLGNFYLNGFARLKPGVTMTQAHADVERMLKIWIEEWPPFPGVSRDRYRAWNLTPVLAPLKQGVIGNVGDLLWVVMGAIGVVLLIAGANVANLLLVRAEGRQQELAIRAALGAGRGRITREILVESLLLGLMGGIAGLGLAYGGLQVLRATAPAGLPRLAEITVDPLVLAFAFGVSVLCGLAFGLIPVAKYAAPRIASALAGGGRTASQGRDRARTRSVLVVTQVGLAMLLLVASGLMIRTFQKLRSVELGFSEPSRVQTLAISIPQSEIADAVKTMRTQQAIGDRLAAIPGVTAASLAGLLPMECCWSLDRISQESDTDPTTVRPLRHHKSIAPGFLGAMGTRLIAGRDVTWDDVYQFRPVTLVSANLARELWNEPSAALGKRIRRSPVHPWSEVIGVVQDVHDNGAHQPAPTAVYWPTLRKDYLANAANAYEVNRGVRFVLRTERAGTASLLNEIRQAVWSVNPNLPLELVRTQQEVVDLSMARTSFTLVMLAIAGSMALVLGVIGLYGVIAYAVSRRRREIGIRIALGAQRAEVHGLFMRHALLLTVIGVAIGLAAAAGLTRLMSSLLFGVEPIDPPTFTAVAILLALAATLASYLPARRASRVDPVEALRSE